MNKGFSYILLAVLLIIGTAFARGDTDSEMRPGVAIFKIDPVLFVDLGDAGASKLGIPAIDRAFDAAGIQRVERKFPFCLPPKPGGTDLRPIYNIYFDASKDVLQVCAELNRAKGVLYAHPWWVDRIFLDHNDPQRETQWDLDLMMANEAHDVTTGDTAVVIAIVDLGIDLLHEDLAPNIWQNLGEDANDDGRITDDDRDSTDNDNNGYIDDFYGWDFQGRDNNPQDVDGHGTSVAGIASARTNNQVGISSIGFRCSLMAVRTGSGVRINFGYEGIEYAARNGADVINCSWGGFQRADAQQEVINYCREQGCVVVCAAGNTNSTRVGYPAGYNFAISVAGTDSLDQKASWSSFGDWIDISAPGLRPPSTGLNNSYILFGGTSAASPHVAGTAALLIARYPDAPPDIIEEFLENGADNIDEQNPAFAGLLGAGRVNAARALVGAEQPMPVINSIDLSFEENGNGKVDPGERAAFTVTVVNRGQRPDTLIVRISTTDREITITNNEVVFPNLEVGGRHTNNDDPFIIEVPLNVIPHTSNFTVTLFCQPGNIRRERNFEFLIGHPNVLLVDDDGGLDYERYYQESVTAIQQGWLRWDCSRVGAPMVETVTDHAMVIWETGDSYPALDVSDIAVLQTSIQNGARILLVGRGIGDEQGNRAFLRRWFGANHAADSVDANIALGLSGNRPVSADVMLYLFGQGGSGDGTVSPSAMYAIPPADSLFVYSHTGAITGLGGVYKRDPANNSKTIYLGFTLAGASNLGTSRHEVIRQMLNWFAPELDVGYSEIITPYTLMLDPAFPNPFNGIVKLNYTLASSRSFKIVILDVQGREVAVAAQGDGLNSRGTALWDSGNLPSGVYVARLQAVGSAPIERKLILAK